VEDTIDETKNVVAMASTRKFGSWPVPRVPLLDAMAAKNVQIARSDKPAEAPAIFTADDEVIEARIEL
jgi:hypothetical protein